ncbi:AAA family ATPase [Marinifilum sp. D737]|uniref:AAA family ATPase n=1 Tax=Marinifilum sp. D737 TaxID=2969628 RepID=UPI0022758988|nr:ATP-binding protein [Marinifilum sp. D737]MCY1635770.1 ATP-binding protein [Marinifilum sp. D737]
MLIRFVTSNFLSFDSEVEFNMIAGSLKTHKHHVYNLGKLDILKGSALYGANGAGKSNLIRAIDLFQDLVMSGIVPKNIEDKKFKLENENNDKPIFFEIEFQAKKKIFSYGININNNLVTEEYLYESGINKEDKLIFERTLSRSKKPTIKMAPKYLKTQKAKLLIELLEDNLLKNNELLLSKHDSLKIKDITDAINWIKDKLLVIYPHSKFTGLVQMLSTSNRFKGFANDLLETFDTGISELSTEDTDIDKYFGEDDEKLKKEIISDLDEDSHIVLPSDSGAVIVTKEDEKYLVKKVISYHKNSFGENVKFDLEEESDGTQRLLDFIPAFDLILKNKVTVLIDEIDHSLHPALLKTLIQKIMVDERMIGQIIFTTHESNLLDFKIFRQDEIWFVEKDKQSGSSSLYSLSDFKPRYDLDIRKGYLKGRFGAIPFLANLIELNWNDDYDEKEERI